MSVLTDAVTAIRDAIKMADDVKRTGDTLKEVAKEMREYDRRILVLETQWATAMAFNRPARSAGENSTPRRIARKK